MKKNTKTYWLLNTSQDLFEAGHISKESIGDLHINIYDATQNSHISFVVPKSFLPIDACLYVKNRKLLRNSPDILSAIRKGFVRQISDEEAAYLFSGKHEGYDKSMVTIEKNRLDKKYLKASISSTPDDVIAPDSMSREVADAKVHLENYKSNLLTEAELKLYIVNNKKVFTSEQKDFIHKNYPAFCTNLLK